MRVLYQPTEATPGDWREMQADAWDGFGLFTCHALCVQGVTFDGADHYSVEVVSPTETRVVTWYDDPADWPPGQRWAREWTFRRLGPSTNPLLGGAITPEHRQVIYAEAGIGKVLRAAYKDSAGVVVKPWAQFDPRRVNPMPGQWVTEPHHEEHRATQSVRGWREWTEGLDPSELDGAGLVKDQRAIGRYDVPKGTRTYYHNGTNLAIGAVTATNENAAGTSAAGAASENSGNIKVGVGTDEWACASPSNEPSSAAWPTTGTYRYQIDCTAVSGTTTFGLLTLGGGSGGFLRLSSTLATLHETFAQGQGAFSGTGLHLATAVNPSWTSGAVGDRVGVMVAAIKNSGHGNDSMTLQLGETDDFLDGPWAAAAAPTDHTIFFGANF